MVLQIYYMVYNLDFGLLFRLRNRWRSQLRQYCGDRTGKYQSTFKLYRNREALWWETEQELLLSQKPPLVGDI